MKTAVSIPDELFEEAEKLARGRRCSRSEVYSRALAEYVARHSPERVTEAMNAALAQLEEPSSDSFTMEAARETLRRTEW